MDEATALAVASRAFPGRAVELEGQGQLNWAVRVGDDLVVRVPRHRFGVERLAFEVRLLEHIRPRLTVAVPEIVAVALDGEPGAAYVAHTRIPGVVLRREMVATLADGPLRRIAGQVATFLRELHGLAALGVDVGAETLAPDQFARRLRAEVDALIAPRVSAGAVARAHDVLDGLARIPDEPLLLCHTDIGGNIVVDEHGNVGVIDFGSCFVTHPALDAASLAVLGDRLLALAAAEYPLLGEVGDAAGAVRATFALQDALYGARQEDWPHVAAVMAAFG